MEYVYILTHTRELPNDDEEVHYLGVYSTLQKAKMAIERMSKLPKFSDSIEGFYFERYKLNEDEWKEGFFTDIHGNK